MNDSRVAMRWVWIGVIALILLRQDFWFWDDPTLVLGLLPIGLAWQVLISIGAAALWLAAIRYAWPTDRELMGNPIPAPRPAAGPATAAAPALTDRNLADRSEPADVPATSPEKV
jgi:hypothetical protein